MKKIPLIAMFLAALFLPAANYAADQSFKSQTMKEKIQYLMDREEIGQLIVNYGLSFDRKDWELHRSLFTKEVQMDFSASIGDGLKTMKADDWVAGVKPFFAKLKATQHIGIPLSIQINGNEAYVISLLRAAHYQPNEKGEPTQTMFGYYENWLKRTDKGWKIYKIVQHIDWNEGNYYVFEKAAGISE